MVISQTMVIGAFAGHLPDTFVRQWMNQSQCR